MNVQLERNKKAIAEKAAADKAAADKAAALERHPIGSNVYVKGSGEENLAYVKEYDVAMRAYTVELNQLGSGKLKKCNVDDLRDAGLFSRLLDSASTGSACIFRLLDSARRTVDGILADPAEATKKAWDPHKPTFYFMPRAAVLSASAKQLRRMQETRDSFELVKLAVDLNEAFQGMGLIQNVLFVSHRWEDSATPDETGAQLAALKAHLRAHPEVQYVWFDYACMPQRSSGCPQDKDDRTPAEKAEFDLMLSAIADLYLTAKVLILLDTAYRTRFWTTMEGWCAMQKVTSQGVRPATEGESRVTVACIHNATQHDEQALLEMSTKTPTEISRFLASPDVFVTNKNDKTTMLPIVGKTNEHVREMMSGMHSC